MKDGDVARGIPLLPGGREPVILATTTHDSDEIQQLCRDAGMDGFLLKPFDAARILQAIVAVDHRRSLRSRRSGDSTATDFWYTPSVRDQKGLNFGAFRHYAQARPDNPDAGRTQFLETLLRQSRALAAALERSDWNTLHGFIDKNEQPLPVLQEAVQTVMAGRHYFSSTAHRLRIAMRSNPLEDFSKLLSEKEQELLKLFGEGFDNDVIATKSGLAWGTVRNHRNNIMAKLNLHSTPELMRYAIEKGFVRPRKTATATR